MVANPSMVSKIYFLKVSCEQIHAVPLKALKGLYLKQNLITECANEKNLIFFTEKEQQEIEFLGYARKYLVS